jgi:hypothetical protein
MGYILFAPEMVSGWAARQHYGAKHFAKKHQRRGWTMTHAFFLIMGGFTLHDEQGTALRILEPIELESLSEAGKIEWPSITKEEIHNGSMGDYLSKAIILVQTSWFIAQCIVRGAYRLEVTQLEVATVAYAVLTGVTYYLWWEKPLGIRYSIPVYLLKDDEKEDVDLQDISSVSPVSNPDPVVAVSPVISSDLNSNHVDSQSPPISEETRIPPHTFLISGPAPNSQEPRESESSHDDPIVIPDSEPQSTVTQRIYAYNQGQIQKHGTVLGLAFTFLRLVSIGLALALQTLLYPLSFLLHDLKDLYASDILDDSMPLRVPKFYSPKFRDYGPYPHKPTFSIAFCTALIFGAIHCIAWSFPFPSLQERLAWRISAASVVGSPILITVFTLLGIILEHCFQGWGGIMIAIAVCVFPALYLFAKIVLLVLACIALRALPPTALVEMQWAASFPHIG